MAIDKIQLFDELNKLGEAEVRIKVAQGVFNLRKTPLVLEWLRQREEERDAERVNEELRLAREANNMASAANGQARFANRLSAWSICIALLALVLALLGYKS